MGRVVSLAQARAQKMARTAFGRWPQRLGHRPRPEERLADLPSHVLGALAELKHQATLALYDVVLGVHGWGPGERFYNLEARAKLEALDAFLFLADQVRWELMHRLGWLAEGPAQKYSILDLASRNRAIQAEFGPEPPRLTEDYPGFERVRRRLKIEPEAVVRSLIPQALAAFKEHLA
ncbi:MAG: hypothetical protein C4525_12165 [Desulfarculus sp.]|nr:MAG: hypothetical protein C4525_12165 [Desulfarculus sp.]